MQLRDIYDVDRKLIYDILAIDAQVYPADYQGTYEEVAARFTANRDMFVLLYDADRLAGYVCLFPIKRELHDRILASDRVFDSDIPGQMVEPYVQGRRHSLFLISVALHPDYQNRGLASMLRTGFYRYLLNKRKNGIDFDTVLAVSVSQPGERFLQKAGFVPLKVYKTNASLYALTPDDDYFNNIAEEAGS